MDFCERFDVRAKSVVEGFLEALATQINPLQLEQDNNGKSKFKKKDLQIRKIIYTGKIQALVIFSENFEKRGLCLLDNIDRRSQGSNFDFIVQFLDNLNSVRTGLKLLVEK